MNKLRKNQWIRALGLLTALSSIASNVSANGFWLPEQNATNLGTSYAGTASLAEDASTNFYNSAGLTRICQEQIVLGGVVGLPNTKLNVTRATATNGAFVGTGTVRPADDALVPFMHYAKRISDCWVLGFSVVSPFGSKTDYSSQSIARYTAVKSKLITLDVCPSIAYKLTDNFSVGAGFDALYADATLSTSLNPLGGLLPGVSGVPNPATDGFQYLNGSRWAFGYHAGVLFEFNDCTRFGINYHSRIEPNLKGYALTQPSNDPLASVFIPGANNITKQGARAKLKMPDSAVISAYHAFNDCFAVMADAQWFHWKIYDKLNVNFDDGSTSTTINNWKDSYRFAIGGTYQFDPCLKFRMGTSYDKTPTRLPYRTIYITDEDEIGVAIGAQYRFNKCLAFDFGYAHIFQEKADIQQAAPTLFNPPAGVTQPMQNIQGTVKRGIDVLGLQATWDLL